MVGFVVEVLTTEGYTDLVVDSETDKLLIGRRWDATEYGPSCEVATMELSGVMRIREY